MSRISQTQAFVGQSADIYKIDGRVGGVGPKKEGGGQIHRTSQESETNELEVH